MSVENQNGNIIITDRFKLRPPDFADQDFFINLYANAEVMRHIPPTREPSTEEDAKLRLERLINHWVERNYGMFVIELKDTSTPIGYCGLRFLEETEDIELGYIINQPYWGIGVASEAAMACVEYAKTVLKADRIISVTDPDNFASQKVLCNLGFKRDNSNDGCYHGMAHHFFALQLYL